MTVFKKHVSRRAVLKGVGASIALPLLDAMNPAATAWAHTPAGAPPKRFAFVGFPHGAIMDKWSRAGTGANYEMSPILQPLEPFRKHMTIVSGLRNKPAETPEPHGYIEMTWLTCVKPWDRGTNGADWGVSADQLAARHIGQETRVPSLELTTALGGARRDPARDRQHPRSREGSGGAAAGQPRRQGPRRCRRLPRLRPRD